ncbi:VCBS repeat-containing protein [Maribacter chungangensis]|uniref:VCBS repeat-containing protein n=1 Tax=Maribacter chungangensis TaxID=1069117 RepID=A0ABW3B6F1_9FLAO
MKLYAFLIVLLLFSCAEHRQKESPLFVQKDSTTGLHFENKLVYDEGFNPYLYRNFYNGGGVALGDINNDGLVDIYLTGNMVDNKLFLNKGNWEFEDITANAGVACTNVWSTGATFADINNDGYLDLYVCKSGKPGGTNRHNELFINQGDMTFKEEAKNYDLDIEGLSIHSAFFDFDKDGDLDVYILNNSLKSIGGFDLKEGQRNIPDASKNGNKFLRNDGDHFTDITEKAGIYSSKIGFGLGITLGDFNNDNWTDIYIANDFFERDYLYINDTEGGFKEDLDSYFESISMGAMGVDMADLNNDALTDLMVAEMLPATDERKKTKTLFESWDKQQIAAKKGYFNQYARNTLQRNYGPFGFLEIGRQAGVADTEWSWGTLLFDMDNDGLKDIFVSNGIFKDLLDRDYLAFEGNEENIRNSLRKREQNVITSLIDAMPSQAVPNGVFRNNGAFNFDAIGDSWGLATPSFSNGSAYGDLDNDGDLDLVVNNVNMPSFIYENMTDSLTHKSLRINLVHATTKSPVIGAKVILKTEGEIIGYGENFVSRGFQSSVPYGLHFGLGSVTKVDSLLVTWPNGTTAVLTDVESNNLIEIKQPTLTATTDTTSLEHDIESTYNVLQPSFPLFTFEHKENRYIDFDNERLLSGMSSNEGPAMAVSDINGDTLQDFYMGGAKYQSGSLFLSTSSGYHQIQTPFNADKEAEETDALFFDADNDGDMDLYVCHGGKAFSSTSVSLNDVLYINTGEGNFIKSTTALKFPFPISSSVVTAADYDNDGDIDLFVGERYKTNLYGLPGSGYLLENNGDGEFSLLDIPLLKDIGMITQAQWGDLNGDGWEDLIILGEWMSIKVFLNQEGLLGDKTVELGLQNNSGLWTALHLADVDSDGDLDIVAGNLGHNTFYAEGMKMFIADFDGNGFKEQIICQKRNNKYYPIADKDELVSQLPSLKKKLLYYADYAKADMGDIFSPNQLSTALQLELENITSTLFINNGSTFTAQELPTEIQHAPVYAINSKDIDGDGHTDLFFGGNQFLIKPQFGRYDASKGWAIFGPYGDNENKNNLIPLNIDGQIRKLNWVKDNKKDILTVGKNNEKIEFYEVNDIRK